MPVVKCSNGKWRIGNGSCVYDTKEKAVEVWQAILATGKYKTDDNNGGNSRKDSDTKRQDSNDNNRNARTKP